MKEVLSYQDNQTAPILKKKNFHKIGRKSRERIGTTAAYIVIILASLMVILPLVWIFFTSIKTRVQSYQIPPIWVFTPSMENYTALLVKYPFPRYFLNSTIISFTVTFLALFLGSLAAYSISRFNTGGNFLKMWILNSYTMPPIAILIPFFLIIQFFRLFDTYPALIFANLAFLLPFVIWILIGFFDGVPKDIEEAARMDGATTWQALWRVTFPIAAPGITAAGILSFLFSWNEFLFALIFTGNNTRTLPVAIANFKTQYGIEMGELSAATMVMIIPVIILAFSIRGYLVKGLSLGAVK